jgi:hypothetical protein
MSDLMADVDYDEYEGSGQLLMSGGRELALLIWKGDLPKAPMGCQFEETTVGEDAWGVIVIK